MNPTSSIPYDDRSDLQKLASQWRKIAGILSRDKEWSAAIVRAATAAEIAANIAIRKGFERDSGFSTAFVDTLLLWANGLDGKFKRLLIPMERDSKRQKVLRSLYKKAEVINGKRNEIVHRGSFANETEARGLVSDAAVLITELVLPFEPTFALRDAHKVRREQ